MTEEKAKSQKVKIRFDRVPITTSIKLPVPAYSGQDVAYSSFYVGFTSLPVEVEWEGEFDPQTGDGLEGMKNTLKAVGTVAFEATQELSREAWQRQREAAQEETFNDHRMRAFARQVAGLIEAELAENVKQAVIAELTAIERQQKHKEATNE